MYVCVGVRVVLCVARTGIIMMDGRDVDGQTDSCICMYVGHVVCAVHAAPRPSV